MFAQLGADEFSTEEQDKLAEAAKTGLWDAFSYAFFCHLRDLTLAPPEGWTVMRSDMYRDAGVETIHHTEFETLYTAKMLTDHLPRPRGGRRSSILDIGSYKQFVVGLTAAFDVTIVDVRPSYHGFKFGEGHKMICCDAKKMPLNSNSQECIISLCTIEHCGLGRYGDEFDLDGDIKVFDEMKRVLAPGGLLIFSTTISNSSPVLFFNAHRVYTHDLIKQFCEGLELENETFFNHVLRRECSFNEITEILGDWSLYCGTWRKPK